MHHRINTLARVHHHHGLLAALHGFGLVLVGVLEQLQSVADLALVESVRAIRWLSCAGNGLLGGPSGRLVRAIATLRAIKGALLIIV